MPIQASDTGNATSVPFLVNDGTLIVDYAYDCSSTGGSGFSANLISGSASDPGSDTEGIADESGTGGSASVTVYPQDTGSDYYLQVSTPCQWQIVVKNG